MPQKNLLLAIASTIYLSGCSNNASKNHSNNLSAAAAFKPTENDLIEPFTRYENFEFKTQQIEDIGSMQFPTGRDWERKRNCLSNEKIDFTLTTQSWSGDFTTQVKDYIESILDAKKREVPSYGVRNRKEGKVNGLTTVKLDGGFINGKSYITRDYFFFNRKKVFHLMSKVEETQESNIGLVDYMVSTLR